MPRETDGASVYFWGDDLVRMGIGEQLERLRMGASLAMAVAPEEEGGLREVLVRMGCTVEPVGHGLLAHRP